MPGLRGASGGQLADVRPAHGLRGVALKLVQGEADGAVGAYSLFDSDGYEDDRFYGVRPVVALKSDVTIEDIQKIGEQQEPTWE